MNDVIGRFLRYLEVDQERAQNTILAYETDIRQFVQVLSAVSEQPIEPGHIDEQKLDKYVSWLNRQGYKTSTVARKIAAVRTLLDYMHSREGHDTRTMLDMLDLPQNPRQPPKVLTTTEVEKLLRTASQDSSPRAMRDSAALSLMYATGLRAVELISLNASDIDLQSGAIRANATYSHKTTSSGARQVSTRGSRLAASFESEYIVAS
ncbi:MAG: site-specific integrase [Anaerolineales bacterium]